MMLGFTDLFEKLRAGDETTYRIAGIAEPDRLQTDLATQCRTALSSQSVTNIVYLDHTSSGCEQGTPETSVQPDCLANIIRDSVFMLEGSKPESEGPRESAE